MPPRARPALGRRQFAGCRQGLAEVVPAPGQVAPVSRVVRVGHGQDRQVDRYRVPVQADRLGVRSSSRWITPRLERDQERVSR